jgi:hypothetical protein
MGQPGREPIDTPAPTMPAHMLLTPAGATDAEAVEKELTKLLFSTKK